MVIQKPNVKVKKVFLAGPIQGAPNWHEELIEVLSDKNVIVASPKVDKGDDFSYDNQVNWETDNLETADIIVFYLVKEKDNIPGRSYAQTSRFEIGENLARIKYTGSNQKVLIYGEKGFHGLSYIKLKAESGYYKDFTTFYDNKKDFLADLELLIEGIK